MKITMELTGKEKDLFMKMVQKVDRLELELCGGELTNGFVKDMTASFAAHIKDDKEAFAALNDKINPIVTYNEKQKLMIAYSWKIVGLFTTALLLIGGFAQWLITTLISLHK